MSAECCSPRRTTDGRQSWGARVSYRPLPAWNIEHALPDLRLTIFDVGINLLRVRRDGREFRQPLLHVLELTAFVVGVRHRIKSHPGLHDAHDRVGLDDGNVCSQQDPPSHTTSSRPAQGSNAPRGQPGTEYWFRSSTHPIRFSPIPHAKRNRDAQIPLGRNESNHKTILLRRRNPLRFGHRPPAELHPEAMQCHKDGQSNCKTHQRSLHFLSPMR